MIDTSRFIVLVACLASSYCLAKLAELGSRGDATGASRGRLISHDPTAHNRWLSQQPRAETFFQGSQYDKWTESVIVIATHDPRVGTYSWHPERTGFIVGQSSQRPNETIAVSTEIEPFAGGAYTYHAHIHPFRKPATYYARPVSVSQIGSVNIIRMKSTSNRALPIVDENDVDYGTRFPVALIGYHDNKIMVFCTYSIGPIDDSRRIRLADRPPTGIGEFCGAPVINKNGAVVGMLVPHRGKPSYARASLLRSPLRPVLSSVPSFKRRIKGETNAQTSR